MCVCVCAMQLKDTDLRSLLSHPTLSHGTLGCDIMLEERHVDSACNWETLRVQVSDIHTHTHTQIQSRDMRAHTPCEH